MLADEIQAVLTQMGIGVTEQTVSALAQHASMLLEANRSLNLTRITDEQAVARLHVADSLTALPLVIGAPPGPLADLGAGGGYPGIPLAIASGRPLTLIESTTKKAAFLESVLKALELGGEVLAERAEDAARTRKGRFAIVTARAVAPLPSLVELAAPLLVRGGQLIAMKGEPSAGEVESGDRAAAIVGLRREKIEHVRLPGGDEHRTLVVYSCVAKPRIKLPRRPGQAQHNPLG